MGYRHTLEEHDRIFCEGCKARHRGQSLRDNPYPPGIKRITWAHGWRYTDKCRGKLDGCPLDKGGKNGRRK